MNEIKYPWKMHASMEHDEASKDPRTADQDFSQHFTEHDFEGHRIHTVYLGLHIPSGRRHLTRRRKYHIYKENNSGRQNQKEIPATPPAQRVQFILGEDDCNGVNEIHPVFSEMMLNDEFEWKEIARWIKFEEDVEEGGNRWSKPHVATLFLHSLFELRNLLQKGSIILDMEATTLEIIIDLLCDNLVSSGTLPLDFRGQIAELLLRRHRHQHEYSKQEKGIPIIRSLAEISRNQSASQREHMMKSPSNACINPNNSSSDLTNHKRNTNFMRKIPPGAEANNILVGEVDCLKKILVVFIRLKKGTFLGDLTEVPIPSRFIFIALGGPGSQTNIQEIGRAVGTLMSDKIFHEVAYRAKKSEHLIAGIDEFLDAVTVLPPGEWDPAIRIEPPAEIPSQDIRKRPLEISKDMDEEEEEQLLRYKSGLIRTGHLFGGLKNDFKRKAVWYYSDFKDGISVQCVASWIFLYFACLSPIITFGGLLSQATGKNIAAMESLVSGFICGIGYGLFSGQPLTILGSTGPVLVFETIVYDFCLNQGWDYLTFRFWIGSWIAAILLLLTAIDASALVCYITRFTEENFATLIAFIFIYKAIENVWIIKSNFPITNPIYDCVCTPPANSNLTIWDYVKYKESTCLVNNGTLIGIDCARSSTENIFLMSLILFLGTFIISVILKNFKNAPYFPSVVRQYISDFAVIIAILSMSFLDFIMNIATPKLDVPHEFKPTLSSRGWLVPLFTTNNPWWTSVIAIFPAMLGTILIFMDQQITSVIINRKENKLKKGCGYHLDLFILSILIQICSFMGLPWFVAATVLSINHVNSLKLESECSAPGEKPQFLGVREQRVTHVLIFLTIGLSVTLTPLLCHIPMPVLYGVFLYMGIASLSGLQFFDRILIMFMPLKYQPDFMFLRKVPIKRVHLFTAIQLACLIILWVIKSFSQTSILFPLMLVVMIGIRKALDMVFTRRELKILDDLMPEIKKSPGADDSNDGEAEMGYLSKLKRCCLGESPASKNPKSRLSLERANVPNLTYTCLIHTNTNQDMNKSQIHLLNNYDELKPYGTSQVGNNHPDIYCHQNNSTIVNDQFIVPVSAKVRHINRNAKKKHILRMDNFTADLIIESHLGSII
ncbi:electroneutral sodium bicarbonate exchanger 1 isoform X3 [Ceratitis capitata]|uniref:electroneutral sodium bicarbonate exchanger 1 isoform X3 n=1 Tax=Ceratitis capitata TaxID=7213 RepID=UPI0006188E99|nr:electroneutral sodium bicarbonate exchanger 1 isoform X3 [Ceratitis capitata]